MLVYKLIDHFNNIQVYTFPISDTDNLDNIKMLNLCFCFLEESNNKKLAEAIIGTITKYLRLQVRYDDRQQSNSVLKRGRVK